MKILVVDDSATMRKIFRDELETAGYEVIEAENGEAALDKITHDLPIDLITLDIDMPGMSGFDVCEKIYGDEYLKLFKEQKTGIIPVVFITSNDTLDDRKKGFELGATEFIVKPFVKGELVSAVNRILRPVIQLQGLTALVVDDSLTARINIARALAQNGVNIIEAGNGLQAYEIIRNQMGKIDILIVDLVMPEMNGDVLCKKVRNELNLKDIPVVFLTAMCDQTELLKLFNVGGTDYLVKPFAKEELVARIMNHLERAKLTKSLRETVNTLNREVADHKRAREEIKKLNIRLQARVLEGTEKYENIQNEIMQKEYKGELADITAITLNNVSSVLNGIKTSIEVLEKLFDGKSIKGIKAANRTVRDHIDKIEEFICYNPKGKQVMHNYLELEGVLDDEMDRAIAHMERIHKKLDSIEKTISVQRSYSKGSLKAETIKIPELIEDALTMQAGLLESRAISVIKKMEETPRIKGQKTKLMCVLMNLIENAQEAMDDAEAGSRVITLSTALTDSSVRITVQDTGTGIPVENMPRIFQKDFSSEEERDGSGLYYCEKYIREMGGMIRAKSPGKGKGASFILTLPLK